MAFCPTSLRFPAIAHVLPSPWKNEIRAYTEVLIGYTEDATTCEDMCKIKRNRGRRVHSDDISVSAETGLHVIIQQNHPLEDITK
jgi:hypothetical protein